ncbi:MAG: histidine phosphatase family protein [Rhizobium sp.]|nr:histidine phosphatase family protein [Rhizobium sp.]
MTSSSAETFRLYLVRHAHAAWGTPGVSDFDRPLDETGRYEARDVAEQAVLSGLVPDVLVSSPALRCRQTAHALLDVFRSVQPLEDLALYSGGPDAYFAQIRKHAGRGSLMIVGHNPMVEALAAHLARTGDITAPLAIGYPTAGLLALDIARPLPADLSQSGEPVALIRPSLT